MINKNLNDFDREVVCTYKNETYSVRDNGSVLRHSKKGKLKRKNDDTWTFGEIKKNGFREIAGERVHRIVAIAFLGEPPSPQHIINHRDTNQQNNRPENLCWKEKIENAFSEKGSEWIKLGSEWYIKSKTKGALQHREKGVWGPVEFTCCPQEKGDNPIKSYFNNIKVGDIFYKEGDYGHKIIDIKMLGTKNKILVKCKNNEITDACDFIKITFEYGVYIHFLDLFYQE